MSEWPDLPPPEGGVGDIDVGPCNPKGWKPPEVTDALPGVLLCPGIVATNYLIYLCTNLYASLSFGGSPQTKALTPQLLVYIS